jgi:hypothetical protein
MDVPQVPDQLKKAPTLALRTFFAGVGKMLLAADRPPARPPADEMAGQSAPASASPPPTGPPPSGPKHAAPRRSSRAASAASRSAHRWRSLDETGNVRVLAAEDAAGGSVVGLASDGASTATASAGPHSASQVITPPVATQPLTGNVPVGASLVIHELPLPGFNTMSLAAIRARLRTLDVDQLQALLVHESKSAQRPYVMAMIERRIEKVESGE